MLNKPRLFLDPSKGESELSVAVHEVCHALQSLLVGLSPNWVTVIPGPNHLGLTSSLFSVVFDTGFDWTQPWKYWMKIGYSGLIGEAFLTGEYPWQGARLDFGFADEVIRHYGVTPEQDLESWIECHENVRDNWRLIEEMAGDLHEHKILSSEYFENFLLTETQVPILGAKQINTF